MASCGKISSLGLQCGLGTGHPETCQFVPSDYVHQSPKITPSRLAQLLELRAGNAVKRCHAEPIIGEYTVGAHSANALCILITYHPRPGIDLITALLMHDAPERHLGDLPAPAKWHHPMLRAEYEAAEEDVIATHFPRLGNAQKHLTPSDWQWLKAIDAVEFLMWCNDQVLLGSRRALGMKARIVEHICKMVLPEELQELVQDQQMEPRV